MGKTVSTTKKYHAFISYSSDDKRTALWLRKKLENHSIPKEFIGQPLSDGSTLKKRLRPIFRDRDELAGSTDLGDSIQNALANSRCLIVLCSPSSARSKWVNQEIIEFRKLDQNQKILPLILNGEPNATTIVDRDRDEECFPPALRSPSEPLAGDLRKEGDGKERGMLKILAGITQLDFNDLYRRHQRAQQKKRILIGIITSMIILALTGLTIFAFKQRDTAQQNLIKTHLIQGTEKAEQGAYTEAAAWLSHALRLSIKSESHQTEFIQRRLSSLIASGRFVIPKQLLPTNTTIKSLRFSPSGQFLLTSSDRKTAQLWKINTDDCTPIGKEVPFTGNLETCAAFNADESLWVCTFSKSLHIHQTKNGKHFLPPLSFTKKIQFVSFSKTGMHLVTAFGKAEERFLDEVDFDSIAIVDVESGKIVKQHSWHPQMQSFSMNSQGTYARIGPNLISLSPPFITHKLPFNEINHVAFPVDRNIAYVNSDATSLKGLHILDLNTFKKENISTASPLGSSRFTLDKKGQFLLQEQTVALTGERSGYLLIKLNWQDQVNVAEVQWQRQLENQKVILSPKGNMLCSYTGRGSIQIFDTEAGNPISARIQHPSKVQQVIFHPNETVIATIASDSIARFWDLTYLRKPSHPSKIALPESSSRWMSNFTYLDNSDAINHTEYKVIHPDNKGHIKFSNYSHTETAEETSIFKITLHQKRPKKVKTHHQKGSFLKSGGYSPKGTFYYYHISNEWNEEGITTVRDTNSGHIKFTSPGRFLTFSDDETKIVLQNKNSIKIISIHSGSDFVKPLDIGGTAFRASLSPQSNYLAFSLVEEGADTPAWGEVWYLPNRNQILKMDHDTNWIFSEMFCNGPQAIVAFSFSADEKLLASLSAQHWGDGDYEFGGWIPRRARVWDLNTGLPATEWLERNPYRELNQKAFKSLSYQISDVNMFVHQPCLSFDKSGKKLHFKIKNTIVHNWDFSHTIKPETLINLAETLSGVHINNSHSGLLMISDKERISRWSKLKTSKEVTELIHGMTSHLKTIPKSP